jgi:hypothetical protein
MAKLFSALMPARHGHDGHSSGKSKSGSKGRSKSRNRSKSGGDG